MSKTQSKLGITVPGPDCCCWSNIIYYYNAEFDSYSIRLLIEGCASSSIFWEFSEDNGTTWSNVPFPTDPGFLGDTYFYFPDVIGANGPGLYRVKITKTACCDTYSNVMEWFAPV